MTVKFEDVTAEELAKERDITLLQNFAEYIELAQSLVRHRNEKWWQDIDTGLPITRNVGELLMLQVSEIAEAAEDSPQYNMALMEITKCFARAMEGHRKTKMDDKLPHRPMVEVEMADVLIRLLDFCGGLKIDLAGAFLEKMAFNVVRIDHTHAHRKALGGKAY